MVKSYGRSSNDLDSGTFQQGFGTGCSGTDYKGIGITHILGSGLCSGEVKHLGIRLEYSFQEGYLIVTDYLHLSL